MGEVAWLVLELVAGAMRAAAHATATSNTSYTPSLSVICPLHPPHSSTPAHSPTGPLTNLAAAVALDPHLPRRLRGLVVLGGGEGEGSGGEGGGGEGGDNEAGGGGNVTRWAEFNFYQVRGVGCSAVCVVDIWSHGDPERRGRNHAANLYV